MASSGIVNFVHDSGETHCSKAPAMQPAASLFHVLQNRKRRRATAMSWVINTACRADHHLTATLNPATRHWKKRRCRSARAHSSVPMGTKENRNRQKQSTKDLQRRQGNEKEKKIVNRSSHKNIYLQEWGKATVILINKDLVKTPICRPNCGKTTYMDITAWEMHQEFVLKLLKRG